MNDLERKKERKKEGINEEKNNRMKTIFFI